MSLHKSGIESMFEWLSLTQGHCQEFLMGGGGWGYGQKRFIEADVWNFD